MPEPTMRSLTGRPLPALLRAAVARLGARQTVRVLRVAASLLTVITVGALMVFLRRLPSGVDALLAIATAAAWTAWLGDRPPDI